MRKFRVYVKVSAVGYFDVKADSREEAEQIVENNAWVMRGDIGTSDDNVVDWEWPYHTDKKILKNRPR